MAKCEALLINIVLIKKSVYDPLVPGGPVRELSTNLTRNGYHGELTNMLIYILQVLLYVYIVDNTYLIYALPTIYIFIHIEVPAYLSASP